jgi:hypothetical protein
VSKNLIYVLFLVLVPLVGEGYAQPSEDYPFKLKGIDLKIKQKSVKEISAHVRSKPDSRRRPVDVREISELAKSFGLGQWIDVTPTSQFVSFWHKRAPTEFRLQVEFASLAVVLNAANAGGLKPEADQIYSAPQSILAAVQKEAAELGKVRLVNVPEVGKLSRAEAENKLAEHRLVPEAIPRYATGVSANLVIPHSQDPAPGISVKPGTLVSFGVSMQSDDPQVTTPSKATVSVSLQQKAGDQISCSRDAVNIYRCSINGTSSGLSTGGYGLLLWARPVRPPSDSPGWYLQRPPANGIDRVAADGSWIGVAQLGNAQWPPHEGDIVDLAVSIADADTMNKLMAEFGAVMRNQPVGVRTQTALGLVVTLGNR